MSLLDEIDVSALSPRAERRSRLLIRGLTIAVLAVLIMLVGAVLYIVLKPTSFDPLVFQTVRIIYVDDDGDITIPQVQPFDPPSIYVNDPVPVSFAFCSTADFDFEAVGTSWFVNAETEERYLIDEGVVSIVRTGCVAPRTEIDIPAQVRSDILDLPGFGPNGEATRWFIEGTLRPTRAGGQTASWQSETFLIIADNRPN